MRFNSFVINYSDPDLGNHFLEKCYKNTLKNQQTIHHTKIKDITRKITHRKTKFRKVPNTPRSKLLKILIYFSYCSEST